MKIDKLEETNALISKVNEAVREGNIDADGVMVTFMGDIALSLAIIADELMKEKS